MKREERTPSDHDSLRDLCAGQALGSLDPSDADRLREHLRKGCPDCEREIESYRETVGILARSFDPVGPPPSAEAEFLERIGAGRAAGAAVRFPRSRWLRTLLPAAAMLITTVSLWIAWDARRQSARLVQENLVLHEAVTVMPEPSSRVLPLHGLEPAFHGWAVIETGAPDVPDDDWILIHAILPAEPAGRTYQAWMQIDGEYHRLGRVERDSDGFGFFRGGLVPGNHLTGVVVTLEPQGVSESPTGPRILEYHEEVPGP